MTLIELLFSAAIGSLVLLTVTSLTIYSVRAFAAVFNYVDLDQYSRKTLDRMSLEIRQADQLTSYSTNRLVFNFAGGVNNLSYTYDPVARTLMRTNGAQVETMLKECDVLTFSIFNHSNVSNSFDQFPAASGTNCKLVRVDWVCSRLLLGSKLNTESIQSAKIVIRKQ